MDGRGLGYAVGLFVCVATSSALAAEREHVLPEHDADRAHRQSDWSSEGGWRRSPPLRAASDGSRVAALASVADGRKVALQARGVRLDADGECDPSAKPGPWLSMDETYTGSELHVVVADLDAGYPCAQLRIDAEDDTVVGSLLWELLEPRFPDAGARSREVVSPTKPLAAIPPELEPLGVISREEWVARATQCSATEDDWYRMAIHHTAGPQTSDGSVAEQLRATQAYGMDSGGYCDIPYQMLVGFDGSLYEGRGLALFSGATGGGNNPGNLAICFIGCYHAPDADCVGGVGHDPTDAMMLRGQLLVQTLAELEQIPTTEDDIRGHRDWPGNATACPGSLLHPRLGELREDLAWFSASEVERSWEGEVDVVVGESEEVWIELENTGGLSWLPGVTHLAPTEPRDASSPLYDPSWPTEDRAATVDAEVQPGEVGRFVLRISMSSEDTITQTFGLVHDGATWFADPPWGGGPTDDAVSLTVHGIAAAGSTGGDGGSSTGAQSGTGGEGEASSTGNVGETTGDTGGMALPRDTGGGEEGCGCRSGSGGPGWMALLLLGLLSRPCRTSTRSDRRAPHGCPSPGRGPARHPPRSAPWA